MSEGTEHFGIGIRFNDVKIEFYIDSQSTQGKRWAFFSVLTLIVVLLAAGHFAPQLAVLMEMAQ